MAKTTRNGTTDKLLTTKHYTTMKKVLLFIASVIGAVLGGGFMAEGAAALGGGKYDRGDSSLTTNEPMADEDLYTKSIDDRLVKIRPMSTPIDTIARQVARSVKAGLEHNYFSVGTQPIATKVKTAVTGGSATAEMECDDALIFSESDTIRVVTADGKEYMLFVTGLATSGNPIVKAIGEDNVPALAKGTQLYRMGKACAEKDATAPTYSVVPEEKSNYCQNFMMQIEESTFEKVAEKNIKWNFSDKEEATLYDMKLGMELSYLFGKKSKFTHPIKKQLVWTTEGIWNQAGKDITLQSADITDKTLVDIHKELFTGVGAGSKKKILLAGSDLLAALQKATSDKYELHQNTIDKWNLTFTSWTSNFGEVYVIHEELFDLVGKSKEGLILDPAFLTKGTFIPFGRNVLNLKQAGIKNSDAVVLQEVSCLYLTAPQAHARIALP